MRNSPRDCGPGGQWLGFIFIWWGIVLMGDCPRTDRGITRGASKLLGCMCTKHVIFYSFHAEEYNINECLESKLV